MQAWPGQQAWPAPPHVAHVKVEPPVLTQARPDPQLRGVPLPPQHGSPAAPPQATQVFVPVLHVVPAAVQVLLAQQAAFKPPHVDEPPSESVLTHEPPVHVPAGLPPI